MKATGLIVTYIVFIGFIYLLYLAFYNPRVADEPLNYETQSLFYDYAGITHIHSHRSSGSGQLEEIAAAAKSVFMDFIYITDLNPFEHQNTSEEGQYDGVLLFIAGEYSYLDSKLLNYHNSTFDHLSSPGRIQLGFQELLASKNRNDDYGSFVLSHPFKPGYSWGGEFPAGLNGIEIINLKSLWQQWWEDSKSNFIWTMILYPLNSRLALIRLLQRPVKNLRLWDSLNSKDRYTFGIVGNDAEALATVLKVYPIEIPSYETVFSMATNHVLLKSELTGDFASDKSKITDALDQGQFYMSFDFLANPKGFAAYLTHNDQKHIAMGENVNLSPPAFLNIDLPANLISPLKVTLIKDGEVFMTSDSKETKINLTLPGSYRIEVQVRVPLPFPDHGRWMPWIYTNPFRLLNEKPTQ